MANVMLTILGLILIGFSLIIFIGSMPSLNDATHTGVGTTWENSSSFVKGSVNTINGFITLLPFLIFFGGFGLTIAGVLKG